MAERSKKRRERIVPLGTQIVTRVDTHTPEGAVLQMAGAVAVILQMPVNSSGVYRVRFPDGEETSLTRIRTRLHATTGSEFLKLT